MSLKAYIYVYLLGGLTFLPAVLVVALCKSQQPVLLHDLTLVYRLRLDIWINSYR